MKALTLWQPWASAIAVGAKRNETRSWPAVASGHLYCGWLAITAAKRADYEQYGAHVSILERNPESYAIFKEHGLTDFDSLPLGKIVAVGWLRHSVPAERIAVTEAERQWGDYSPGRYAWMFTEVWRINEPWPVIGGQKIFDLEMPPNWQDQATKVF